jgi:V-containing nitrogenase delta subunit
MMGMQDRIEELSLFIQERCLWQFHSRSWDRKENIDGILAKVVAILMNDQLSLETLQDRCFYANAKILTSEIKNAFPWLGELDESQLKTLIDGVREKLLDVTVNRSLNAELNVPNY